jgi:hypothetical protein
VAAARDTYLGVCASRDTYYGPGLRLNRIAVSLTHKISYIFSQVMNGCGSPLCFENTTDCIMGDRRLTRDELITKRRRQVRRRLTCDEVITDRRREVRRREASLLKIEKKLAGEAIKRTRDEKAATTATATTTGLFYIRTMSSASSILLLHSLSFILHPLSS